MTTTYDIARQIVSKTGGNPGNTAIVRAVAIWITFESGTRILGNNPLNMRPTSYPSGVRPCGVDGKNFIKFCSLDDATSTIAFQLNKHDYRGFGQIGDAIKRGDAMGMLVAVAKSRWSSDNYGGGGKLFNAFRSGTNYNRTLTFGDRSGGSGGSTTGGAGSGSGSSNATLVNFGTDFLNLIPNGKIVTQADADKLWGYIYSSGITKGLLGVMSEGDIKSILNSEIGKPWGPAVVQDIQNKLLDKSANTVDPITALGNTLGDAALTFTVVLIGLAFLIGAILIYVFGNKRSEAAA